MQFDRFRPFRARLQIQTAVALIAICSVALTACADEESADDQELLSAGTAEALGDGAADAPVDIAEPARALPGIDEASVVYIDADGEEHDTLPAESADQAGWVTRVDLVHRPRYGPSSASDAVASVVAKQPDSASSRLEVWLSLSAGSEPDIDVSVLAHPASSDGGDAVRDAHILAETPGVVRAVFDGQSADVRVRDASDLDKVGDVIAAHDLDVDTLRTADGSGALDVADVPARPPHVVPDQWPDDPSAPDCAPEDLQPAIAGHDAFTGHRVMTVAVTNVGGTSCAVEGYPELGFRSLDEQELDVTVTHEPPFGVQDPGAERVVIPTGARALAMAGWTAMSTAEDPEGSGNWPAVTAEILLAAGPGSEPTELPLTSWALTPDQAQGVGLETWQPITTLDILDGAEVKVTAWAAEGTEF